MLWDCDLCVPGGNLLNESHLNGSKAILMFGGEFIFNAVCTSPRYFLLLVQTQANNTASLNHSFIKAHTEMLPRSPVLRGKLQGLNYWLLHQVRVYMSNNPRLFLSKDYSCISAVSQ